VFTPKTDVIILNVASTVAVQLMGINIFSASDPSCYRPLEVLGRWPTIPKEDQQQKCLMMSINYAEVLLKCSRMGIMVYGKYLDTFNEKTFKNFIQKSNIRVQKISSTAGV